MDGWLLSKSLLQFLKSVECQSFSTITTTEGFVLRSLSLKRNPRKFVCTHRHTRAMQPPPTKPIHAHDQSCGERGREGREGREGGEGGKP